MEKLPVLNENYLKNISKMSDKDLFDFIKQWNKILFDGYIGMSTYIYERMRLEQHGLTEKEQQNEDYDKTVIPSHMSAILHMFYILENRMVKKKSEYIT